MATQEKTWNVANRLHSLKDSDNPAVNHIIAGADEIYDDAKGAKQSDINAQNDAALADRYTKAQVDAAIADIDVTGQLADYAKKTEVATALAAKQDVLTFDNTPTAGSTNPVTSGGVKAAIDAVDVSSQIAVETERATNAETALGGRIDDVEDALETKAGAADVEASLVTKQDTITDLATIRSGAALGATAKQPATTLAGYGISDAYTKAEVNNLVSTPHQQYVTVATKADLDAITTGSADTIYRVSNYDGTQVDATKYAEYAWDGTQFMLLSVKSAVGEVFDVSEYNSGATYETLAQALAAVPTSVRKGGMSIKFVQSSDNKYVQYRLMATSWSTTESDWQGVDKYPTTKSGNLPESAGVLDAIGNTLGCSVYHRDFKVSNGDAYFEIDYAMQIGDKVHIKSEGTLSLNTFRFYVNSNQGQILLANVNGEVDYEADVEVTKFVVFARDVTQAGGYNCIISNDESVQGQIRKNKESIEDVGDILFGKTDISTDILVQSGWKYYNIPYSMDSGDRAVIKTLGNFVADSYRLWVNSSGGAILSGQMNDTIDYTSEVAVAEFVVGVKDCTTAGVLSCNIVDGDAFELRISELETKESKNESDISRMLANIGMTEQSESVPQSTGDKTITVLNDIAEGESVIIETSGTFQADIFRFYINGTSVFASINNKIRFTATTQSTTISALVRRCTSAGVFSVKILKEYSNEYLEGDIDSMKGISVSGSFSTTDSAKNVKICDLRSFIGIPILIELEANKPFDRVILGFNGLLAGDYTQYYKYNFLESTKIKTVIIPDFNVDSAYIKLHVAPDYNVSWNYTIKTAGEVLPNADFSNVLVMPSAIYALGNEENSIYHQNYLKYTDDDFFVSGSGWDFLDRCFRSTNPGNLTIELRDAKSLDTLLSATIPVLKGNKSVSIPKNVNCIGDSFTYNGTWFQHIADNVNGLSFVGMRHSYNTDNSLRAEGRGGWSFNSFFEPVHNSELKSFSPFMHVEGYNYYGVIGLWKEAVTGSTAHSYISSGYNDYIDWFDTNGYKKNPVQNDMMYDDANSKYVYFNGSSWVDFTGTPTFQFNYSRYISLWNISSPDIVVIMLGKNDFQLGFSTVASANFVKYMKEAIASIQSYATANNKTINIGICTPTVANESPNNSDLKQSKIGNRYMWQARKCIIDLFDNNTYKEQHVYVIDSGVCLDPLYGFSLTTMKPFTYFEGDERELISTGGVHPSTGGYKQIGTCVGGWIQYIRSL